MIDARLKQYWLNELKLSVVFLERLYRSQEWGEKLEFEVEKSIFVGFYAIRKLLENKHLPNNVISLNWTLTSYPASTEMDEDHWVRNYNHNLGFDKQLSLENICHQFVHSVHFAPFVPYKTFCVGFYFVSDRTQKKELYYIQLVDILNIFLSVANNKRTTLKVNSQDDVLSVNLTDIS